MPTDFSWPRLRKISDEALESPKGISIILPTWHDAEMYRKNLYRFRDRQRKKSREAYPDPADPRHGVCAYDALTFWIRSTVKRTDLEVVFHTEEEISEVRLREEPENANMENENLLPGVCVSMTVQTDKGRATVSFAPSWREAWKIIRQDFPARLIIENGYTIDHLDVEYL